MHERVGSELEAQGQRTDYEHYDYPDRYKADASGRPFTLTDHDLAELNRDWQVVSVVHHGEQPQALEEDAVGSDGMTRYHNEAVLTPGDRAWRPTPEPKPRVDGPQVAFVVGPEGEDIHCDDHGRVKVQFPWDRYAAPDDTASAWLRVSTISTLEAKETPLRSRCKKCSPSIKPSLAYANPCPPKRPRRSAVSWAMSSSSLNNSKANIATIWRVS
ncbi:hypothetical protein GCM10008094_05010 [Aidingimonas halophila]|nr:hypothetical protein GCM10008094_05010 [Aidingimonas halophila]